MRVRVQLRVRVRGGVRGGRRVWVRVRVRVSEIGRASWREKSALRRVQDRNDTCVTDKVNCAGCKIGPMVRLRGGYTVSRAPLQQGGRHKEREEERGREKRVRKTEKWRKREVEGERERRAERKTEREKEGGDRGSEIGRASCRERV